MEESWNLEDVLSIVKNNILMIIITTLLLGCIAAYGTIFLMTPKYEADTQILVSNSQEFNTVNNQDIQTSLQLINTYEDIIKSPTVLDDVANNLELQEATSDISKKIEVTNEDQSQVVTVTVTDESAKVAENIANEVASVFQTRVTEIMNVDNVSVLAPADIGDNPKPVSPQPLINIAVGLILGLILGLGIAFVNVLVDKRIRNENEVQKYLDLPVFGTISKFKK